MKETHFKALKPLCPVCLVRQGRSEALSIGTIERAADEDILEGTLTCPNQACGSVYPIIDGIPILVADLARYMQEHAHEILWRNDLSPKLQSCIGDALGAGVVFDTNRHYLSAYVDGHYRDFDQRLAEDTPIAPVMQLVDGMSNELLSKQSGHRIDLGCSVGRASFELAASRPNELVLGVDLNFTKLRFARSMLTKAPQSYPRKRVGVVYDHHAVQLPTRYDTSNLDFWACDAAGPPFSPESFGLALSLNLLDCVASPTAHLDSLRSILQTTGYAYVATPFDWSAPVTPMDAWLGGHSQHNEWRGESSDILFETLKVLRGADGSRLVMKSEQDLPWEVRLHQRNTAVYQCLLLELQKAGPLSDDTGAHS